MLVHHTNACTVICIWRWANVVPPRGSSQAMLAPIYIIAINVSSGAGSMVPRLDVLPTTTPPVTLPGWGLQR
jgi:hypothetical protein